MSDALTEILGLVPPPPDPPAAGTEEGWRAVEARFGITFPEDYKRLIGRYGTGRWRGCVQMLNPFSKNRYVNQEDIIGNQHLYATREPEPPSSDPRFLEAWNAFRRAARIRREQSPYPFFPAAGGLFPWAQAREPEVDFYWRTSGPPDEWPTVTAAWSPDDRRHSYRLYSLTTCRLLRDWITGRLVLEGVHPRDCATEDSFEPWPFDRPLPQELD